MNPRGAAAQVLQQVLIQGRSLSEALAPAQQKVAGRDRGLVQELVYGVLRHRGRLEAVLSRLLTKPLKPKDADVQMLLLVGLYQLLELGMPPHAAVSATVEAVRARRKPWAVGLSNAVLRRAQREAEQLLPAVAAEPSHPDWLLTALQQAWPDEWQEVIAQNNARAPMTLRVNSRRVSRADYLQQLHEAGLEAVAGRHAPDAVRLARPVSVERLPGFAEGLVSVQDEAAQLAAGLLAAEPGERVLDACAAPGGKACHVLERQPELAELWALDVDAERLGRVQENLERLALAAQLVAGDAAEPAAWWDGRPFDRILIDAPCSGTGVIRRHPDIKWLRRRQDIDPLSRLQARILRGLWPLLAPGGKLVYATCSVLPQENENLIRDFLDQHEDAVCAAPPLHWGRPQRCGRQILPGDDDMDGFYYACLSKRRPT